MKKLILFLLILTGVTHGESSAQAFRKIDRTPDMSVRDEVFYSGVVTAFPNPALNYTTIVLANPSRRQVVAEIIDYNSNIYKSYAFAPGIQQMSIDIGNLERGNYLIRVREDGRRLETIKLIKN